MLIIPYNTTLTLAPPPLWFFSFNMAFRPARTDDKKLTTTLKRIGVTNIPAIEEVNMFKNDGEVIHFVGPKGESRRIRIHTTQRPQEE